MKKSTIALCMIVKNEVHNLPRLFKSIEECFDEIHITDTGSDDGTIEWLEKKSEEGFCGAKVFLHHFKWIDDFAAARNFSFSHAKTDFLMWLDGDDCLDKPESFKMWRDNAMDLADFWLATYHYGLDTAGNPVCSFARERVFRNNVGFQWRYFLHEGVTPTSPVLGLNVKANFVPTWGVKHMRSDADLTQDRSRNIRILEKRKNELDVRLKYYYGKELFDANQHADSIHWLLEATSDPKCEHHDRLLGLQYAAYAYVACNQFERAIAISHQGLQLDPHRAEFYVCIGDSYLKMGKPQLAIPAFSAAKACPYAPAGGQSMSLIFNSSPCYTDYPRMQLARIYVNFGQIDKALIEAKDAVIYGNNEAKKVLDEITRIAETVKIKSDSALEEVRDVIITAPPGTQMYEWDADIAKERGVGGSETAAIQMASWIHKLSGRPVKIFNGRKDEKVCEGVHYISNEKLADYASKYKPKLHVAWRHTIPVTRARTAIWSHDLITPGIDNPAAYDELLCLTPFHKDYAMAMQGVPSKKIWVTRNGIDPARFKDVGSIEKIPGKVMFPSSPDRGLLEALAIMDEVVKEIPHAELHVFYGCDNMRKMGMTQLADRIEAELKERPYVKYHGNVQQDVLAMHFMESEIWLYPASFIETFCITAIEAMAARCYPVATAIGALVNTVGQFAKLGMADLLDERAVTVGAQQLYAQRVISALKEKKWQKIDYDTESLSWESVAKEWIAHFDL